MSAKKSSRVVLQYDLDGNFINQWESMNDAKRNGYHAGHISDCCNAKKSQYNGFIWKFKE